MTNFHSNEATFINKIKLRVENLENQTKFYTEYLGLQVLEQTSNQTTLSADGKTELIILEKHHGAVVKENAYGLYHLALLFDTDTALANVFLNIIEKKYSFDGFSDHGVSKAIYLRDPENNGIELYVDRPQQEWKFENGQVQMYTEPLNYQGLLLSASQDKFERISENTIVGHLHFFVEDLENAEKFFIDVLGLKLMLEFGEARFVSDKGYHHHVGYNTWLKGGTYAQENQTGLVEYYLNTTPQAKENILKNAKQNNVKRFVEKGRDVLVDVNNIRVVL